MVPNSNFRHLLYEIDPSNKNDVATVARLHQDLLDWSPIANLGRVFLKHFIYSRLIRDGLIKAALYDVDGKPVGFIGYTAYSMTFYHRAIKEHWLYVSFLVMISILRNPAMLFQLWKVLRLILARRAEKNSRKDPTAEILAIGVLPEYRNPEFIKRTGLQISRDLVAHAVAYFRSLGLRKMHLLVDEFNKPTIYFYQLLGGHSEPYMRAGESLIKIWFDLDHLDI